MLSSFSFISFFAVLALSSPTGDNLVFIIHNWESGIDASPAYDPAFHVYITELNETSFHKEYSHFKELIKSYRFIYDWNMTAILGRETAPTDEYPHLDTWFKVKDLAVNVVYASGWKILGELATILGDEKAVNHCNEEYTRSSQAIYQKMWNKEQGSFFFFGFS
jgi:hypothetical protein